MNQAQWDQRVYNRCIDGCLWQYFRMDDASGFPQDDGDYTAPGSGGPADMTAGTGLIYQVAGPFDDALGITVDTVFTSPVYTGGPGGTPAGSANYSHQKTMECWARLNNTPAGIGVLVGAGNVAVVMNTDRSLSIFRQGFGAVATTAAGLWPLDSEYHFAMLTSLGTGTSSADAMALYFDEDLVLDTSPGQVAWPIPNGNMLVLGQDSTPGTYTISNAALYAVGALTPDFPETPMVASMSAVVPPAGA